MAKGGGESGTVLPIGPFSGGLNQLEDPRLIGNDQLAVSQNVDIGRSGELIERSGLRRVGAAAQNIRMVGTCLLSSNSTRAFYRNADLTLAYADGSAITVSTAWTALVSTVAGATERVVQYVNSAWFIPKDVQPGGATAQGLRFTLDTNTATTVAGIPRGTGAVVFKDRLFIFGPVDSNNTATQRVYYSAATDFTNFPGANFFDINPGDGEGVTAAIASQDTIIFFKRHSTFVLFYDTDPGLGVLRKVNAAIGATGPDALAQFENATYIVDEKTVYRVQNLLFIDIGKNLNLKNRRINVAFGGSNRDSVFVFGTRILCTVYTGQAMPYEYYVYNTEVDAWSQYVFLEQPDKFYKVINSSNFEDEIATKAGSPNLYVFSPYRTDLPAFGDYPGNVTPVTVRTKKFDMSNPAVYKRLFWWGVDAATAGTLNMSAIADGVSSVVANIVGNGNVEFFKAFVPSRARFLEFLITANSASQKLTILPGVAYVTSHASVDANVTI